jgi:hypothetical protein
MASPKSPQVVVKKSGNAKAKKELSAPSSSGFGLINQTSNILPPTFSFGPLKPL